MYSTRTVIILLVAIVGIEATLLYQQHAAGRAAKVNSDKLLNAFLQGDTAQARGNGVSIRLANVRFKWSDQVYIDTHDMAVRAVPTTTTAPVVFDDPSSFVMALQQSELFIRPEVLQGMLNESVFNYPGSKLRDLKVTLERQDETYALRLNGKLNMLLWVPFEMVSHLSVDTQTNTLVMDVDYIKVFGIPATKLTKFGPFKLDKMIDLPPNGSLMVSGERFMIKPFGLFPPPRVTGRMSGVSVGANGIRLSFAGAPIQAPESSARNYVYLRGGMSQFGNFRMMDTDVLIVDKDASNLFVFSLQHYADMLPTSQIDIHDTKSVRVVMADAT